MKNHAGLDVIMPDEIWAGRGNGSKQRIRIVDTRRDGRVVFERIAGSPDYTLRQEHTTAQENIRAAFEPTGEFDFGFEANLV